MKTGAELIRLERLRQITNKGYDATHDDQHTNGALIMMAAICACDGTDARVEGYDGPDWGILKRHGRNGKNPNRIQVLAIVGALAAAEIDRLQRIKK